MYDIFELYDKYGNNDYIGEEVSQIEHMIQCAMLAEENNERIEVIAACLFHDIGHLIPCDKEKMHTLGARFHENIAEEYLQKLGIKEEICKLVKNHVSAKRYLCTIDKIYYDNLSDASKKTLNFQGNLMSQDEINKFTNDPLFKDYIKVRKYDDLAKVKNKKIKNINYYKNLLEKIEKKRTFNINRQTLTTDTPAS